MSSNCTIIWIKYFTKKKATAITTRRTLTKRDVNLSKVCKRQIAILIASIITIGSIIAHYLKILVVVVVDRR
jgi:hypothetical protein